MKYEKIGRSSGMVRAAVALAAAAALVSGGAPTAGAAVVDMTSASGGFFVQTAPQPALAAPAPEASYEAFNGAEPAQAQAAAAANTAQSVAGAVDPNPTIEKARQFIAEGEQEKAVATLRAFTRKYPNSERVPEAMMEMGKCQKEMLEKSRLLMVDSIVKSYEDMVNRFPQSDYAPQALYQIGLLYEKEMKEYREAIKYFEKCAIDYPTTSYAASSYYRIGQIYENNLNDFDGALMTYQRITKDFFKFQIAVDARLRIQQIYETKTKEPHKALEAYAELINNYPENKKMPEILMNLAKFHRERGDNENAIKTYEQMIEKFPKEKGAIDAFNEIAAIHEANRDYRTLADTYKKMHEKYPNHEKDDQVLFKIAQIHEVNLREYKKKRIEEKTYFKLEPKNLEESIKFYTQLVDTYPQSALAPTALMRIASILNDDLHRGVEAKLMYQAVVDKYPQSKEFARASEIYEKVR